VASFAAVPCSGKLCSRSLQGQVHCIGRLFLQWQVLQPFPAGAGSLYWQIIPAVASFAAVPCSGKPCSRSLQGQVHCIGRLFLQWQALQPFPAVASFAAVCCKAGSLYWQISPAVASFAAVCCRGRSIVLADKSCSGKLCSHSLQWQALQPFAAGAGCERYAVRFRLC